ncbi:MAG: hypothetical protein ACRDH9_03840 [Actinomycetota bacterium]
MSTTRRIRSRSALSVTHLAVPSLLVSLLALGNAPASAAVLDVGPDQVLTFLHPGGAATVSDGQALVARTRSDIETDSYLATVVGAANAAGEVVTSVPELPAISEHDLALVGAMPRGLRQPAAGLYAAIRRAAELLGGPTTDQEMERIVAGLAASGPGSLDEASFTYARAAVGSATDPRPSASQPVGPGGNQFSQENAARSLEARTIVAAGLDRYLPTLRAPRSEGASAGVRVAGCDVLDQLPYLCIGSEVDNTYTKDALLLIDRGGDDTYLNSSGGAPFPLPDQGLWAGVSVIADMSGSDSYGSTAYDFTKFGKQLVVRGGGAAFGSNALGFLVDQGDDDDSYTATVPDQLLAPGTGDSYIRVSMVGQGAGLTSASAGDGSDASGFLFDGGGNDRYLTAGPSWSGTVPAVDVSAQGASRLSLGGSAGVLVDDGIGDDIYRVDGVTPDDGTQKEPSIIQRVTAQGAVFSGATASIVNPVRKDVAVLYDGGGADSFRVREIHSFESGRGFPTPSFMIPDLMAQGFGLSGIGMLLTGVGPTGYEVEFAAAGAVAPNLYAQGAAWQSFGYTQATGINGILDDQGGDDRYLVGLSVLADKDITVTDQDCPNGQPCKADASTSMSFCSLTACNDWAVAAQGGNMHGTALLEDHAGDDEYTFTDQREFDVTLHDELTSPVAAPQLDVEAFNAPADFAQGAGNGNGTAALIDRDGKDRYSLDVGTSTRAAATSLHATSPPVVSAHSIGNLWSVGQGSGLVPPAQGGLFDLGGSGDTFESVFSFDVETPDPDGAYEWTRLWPRLQGGGNAGTSFVALGAGPSIVSSPSRPVCALAGGGARGFGTWFDCDPLEPGGPVDGLNEGAGGFGYAPEATGVATTIAFLDTPSTAPAGDDNWDRVAVAARLSRTGSVLADESLFFLLQTKQGSVWSNLGEVEAITGPDGVARARLPLVGTDSADAEYRIYARFDGKGNTYYPGFAVTPLDIV